MAQSTASEEKAGRELAHLLRLHERLLGELQQVRDELIAPTTKKVVQAVHAKSGGSVGGLGPITTSVEEAIRSLKLSESNLRNALLEDRNEAKVAGIDNLPPTLARFLAERTENPGFHYEVIQDENRGWIIHWKEYWGGRVRGSGQFYERPYAWLED
jgi:acyl-CoA hydrolase